MIKSDDVKHIAKLARLDLSEQEVKKYQDNLDEILGYVEKLKSVDTNGVATSDGGIKDLENVWREDQEFGNYEINRLIDMAPDIEDRQVKVRKIL